MSKKNVSDIKIVKPTDKLIVKLREPVGRIEMERLRMQLKRLNEDNTRFLIFPKNFDIYIMKRGATVKLIDELNK